MLSVHHGSPIFIYPPLPQVCCSAIRQYISFYLCYPVTRQHIFSYLCYLATRQHIPSLHLSCPFTRQPSPLFAVRQLYTFLCCPAAIHLPMLSAYPAAIYLLLLSVYSAATHLLLLSVYPAAINISCCLSTGSYLYSLAVSLPGSHPSSPAVCLPGSHQHLLLSCPFTQQPSLSPNITRDPPLS